MKSFKHSVKHLAGFYIVSFIIISLIGSYLGFRGHRVPYHTMPTQTYEEVSFSSQAHDRLTLGGWYLPGSGDEVAVIVHGWGGNRARLLTLAQFLQRQGISVLTFDLRGGTGKNSYGQREGQDLAGAVTWLTQVKGVPTSHLTVIGVSMGGAAAVIYAANHPIGHLVLISPVVDIGLTKYTVLRDRHFIFPSLYAAGSSLVDRAIFRFHFTNPKDIFNQIDVPTLVLHGTADRLSPLIGVTRLQATAKPNVQFTIIPNAEHTFLDHDEANGFPYSQAIAQFILGS